MPTISQIRSSGTTYSLISKPLYEPLAAQQPIKDILSRFGEHYDLSSNSNLFRFLNALAGESGAGALKKQILYPRLQSALESTHFSDLDGLYGNPLGLPRRVSESYSVDPRNEALTQSQWYDVYSKDAHYRGRCLDWMKAISTGPTVEGIKLAAQAALDVPCEVFERYKYIDFIATDPVPNLGFTNSRQEFVILAQTISLSEADKRRATRLVDHLRPVNTVVTIMTQGVPHTVVPSNRVAASSSSFYVRRLVTGRADIQWPAVDNAAGLWITQAEKEAPTFAFMDRQEAVTYLSISNVAASSIQVGPFNVTQKQLFGNLNRDVAPYETFPAEHSFTKSFAPLQLSVPWTARS